MNHSQDQEKPYDDKESETFSPGADEEGFDHCVNTENEIDGLSNDRDDEGQKVTESNF